MKVKQKLVKSKGKKDNVLRGPKVPKKMKLVNKLPRKVKTDTEPVKPLSVSKTKTEHSAGNTLDINRKTVQQGVQVVVQLHEEAKEKRKALLLTDKENVYLQMVFMRKPDVPDKRRKYLKLHHNLYGEEPEICLFVSDRKPSDRLKRTPDERIEYSVDYYQDFLKKQQIEGISTIMPVFQFRTEFDSYELRRKLVDRFDLFICQSNLLENGAFMKNLGIAWSKKNKIPLVWKFPKNPNEPDANFKEQLAELIRTTWFWLKPHGDTVSMRVGTVSMTQEQLVENISHVLHQIKEGNVVPGGTANIKSLMLKTSKSKAIPLYINLASPNSVPVPIVKSIRPVFDAVEDELSTKPGKKVTVLPSGEVFVNTDPGEKVIPEWEDELTDEDGDFFDDGKDKGESSDDDDDVAVKRRKKLKVKEDEDDSDQEAEHAELKYFASRSQEAEDGTSDEDVENAGKLEKKVKPEKKNKKMEKKKITPEKKKTKLEMKKVTPEKKKTKLEMKKVTPEKKTKLEMKKMKPEEKKKLDMKKKVQEVKKQAQKKMKQAQQEKKSKPEKKQQQNQTKPKGKKKKTPTK